MAKCRNRYCEIPTGKGVYCSRCDSLMRRNGSDCDNPKVPVYAGRKACTGSMLLKWVEKCPGDHSLTAFCFLNQVSRASVHDYLEKEGLKASKFFPEVVD